MSLHRHARELDQLNRRAFLGRVARTALGVGAASLLPGLLYADPTALALGGPRRPTAKRVIYLYLAGGMSHIDTFDPKIDAEVAGPMSAIPSNVDGLFRSEYLPRLAQTADNLC
ncbi:MAG: DUF1501 domain-containing protein, partial [Planctomycetota bacterium]|nr:DUF1501 domain-containing protein [Planctomycetota bacterium]